MAKDTKDIKYTLDNLKKDFKLRSPIKNALIYCLCGWNCINDECRVPHNNYIVNNNNNLIYPRLSLAYIVVKLDELKYEFTQEDFNNLVSCLVYNKSKSYLIIATHAESYEKLLSIMFSKFMPSTKQMDMIMCCYKSLLYAKIRNEHYRYFDNSIFLVVRILINKGYILSDTYIKILKSLDYNPVAVKSDDISVDTLEKLLDGNIISDHKYLRSIIEKIDPSKLANNTICIKNIIKNVSLNSICCNDKNFMTTNHKCLNCKFKLFWSEIVELLIKKGCVLTKETIDLYLSYKYAMFNERCFYKLMDFLGDIKLDETTLDIAINNKLYNIGFYIADIHIGLDFDNLLKLYNLKSGIFELYDKKHIMKYCTIYKDDSTKIYLTPNVYNVINKTKIKHYSYLQNVTELKYTKDDELATNIDNNIDISKYVDVPKEKYQKTYFNSKYDGYEFGLIHILDIIKINDIIPNDKLMNLAICNKDYTSYEQFKTKFSITPNIECMNNAINIENMEMIKDIIQYKILPNKVGYNILVRKTCGDMCHCFFEAIFELLITYGFQINSKLFLCAIKKGNIIENPERFNIKFDNVMYFYLNRYGVLPHYIKYFDEETQELYNIRTEFENYTLDEVKIIVKNKGYIDRYCIVAHSKRIETRPIYQFLLESGLEPVLECIADCNRYFVYNDPFTKNIVLWKNYKKMELNMYGSIENLVKLMETPYY